MEKPNTIVVIGGGQAGGWVLKTLRAQGYEGRLVLIAAEPHAPYERPPLSKAVLAGKAAADSVKLFADEGFEALDIDCLQPDEADSIDRANRTIHCRSGSVVSYDRLVLATGGRVRALPDSLGASAHLHYLRTLDDTLALRQAMDGKRHLAVIGGGWIGLEVAATARQRGLEVTVLEAAERLCVRAAPREISEFLLSLHQRNGVEVRLGAQLTGLLDNGSGVTVQLADGTAYNADLVVAGIGLIPNVELALAAGLQVDNGIIVDNQGRTSDPFIFACGDVANQPDVRTEGRFRLESWANAQNQAIVVAKALLGGAELHDEIPWFWSDQYDVNLQILGIPPVDSAVVTRGDPESSYVTFFFLKDGRLRSVIAINNSRDIKVAKRWMAQDRQLDPAILSDMSVPLKL